MNTTPQLNSAMRKSPDVLGQLKRLLAATPAGAYAVTGMTRAMLEATINEIASHRVAIELLERGRSTGDVQRGLADQLLAAPVEEECE